MDKEFTIRKAKRSDLQHIVCIEKDSFGKDAFSLRQFKYLLTSPNSHFFSATFNSITVGYLIILKRKGSKSLRIYSIAIDANQRGKGLAHQFIDLAIKIAKKTGFKRLTLEVSEKNQTAVALYLKSGFNIVGSKSNYYCDRTGALVMVKEL